MTELLVTCTLARLLGRTRFGSATLLLRPPTGKAARSDEHGALLVAYDDDGRLPVLSPALEYELALERLTASAAYTLRDTEAAEVRTSTRYVPNARGEALVYRVRALTNVRVLAPLIARAAATFAGLARTLPRDVARRPLSNISAALALTGELGLVSPAVRRALVAAATPVRAPALVLAVRAHAGRAALAALEPAELAASADAVVEALDAAVRVPGWSERVHETLIGACADAVSLRRCTVRAPLCTATRDLPPLADALVGLLAYARRTHSTLGCVRAGALGAAASLDGETRALLCGVWPAFVPVPTATEPGRLALARDAELERETARLFACAARVSVLASAGDVPGYRRLLDDRLAALLGPLARPALVVAPTVAHARAYALDALALDDVLDGRLEHEAYAATALVLVHAHGFGIDSLVHAVRAHARTPEALAALHLVLVGDVYDTGGSSRAGDRGAPLRDVAAAGRRGALGDRYTHATLHALSAVHGLNALSPDDYVALRARTPMLPHATVTNAYACTTEPLDTVLAAHRDALLVAGSGLRVARVHAAHELVRPPTSGVWQVPFGAEPLAVGEDATAGGVALEACYETTLALELVRRAGGELVDHRACCRTSAPNALRAAAHAGTCDARGLPARVLAAASPEAVADCVVCVLDDKSGVEDVRAAFALARTHVLFVESASAGATLERALARHALRARTQLVEMLLDGAAAAAAPLEALRVSARAPRAAGGARRLDVVGSTTPAAAGATVVPARVLRDHLRAYCAPEPTAAARAEPPATLVFDAARVDADVLLAFPLATFETLLAARCAALAGAGDGELDVHARLCEPALHCALVHVTCRLARGTAAEPWLPGAEKGYVSTRANFFAGVAHETAVRAYLRTCTPLLAADADDVAPEHEEDTATNVLGMLRRVRPTLLRAAAAAASDKPVDE